MRIEVAGILSLEEFCESHTTFMKQTPLIRFQTASGTQPEKRTVVTTFLFVAMVSLLGFVVSMQSLAQEITFRGMICPLFLGGGLGLTGIIVAAIWIARWRTFHVVLPRFYREHPQEFDLVFVLDDVGFTRKTPNSVEARSWEDIRTWEATDRWMLFEELTMSVETIKKQQPLSRQTRLHVVPRHFFTDVQYRELRAFLTKRFAGPPPTDLSVQSYQAAAPSDGIRPATDGVKPTPGELQKKPE